MFKLNLFLITNYKSFLMSYFFYKRKLLIAILASKNENRSSFNEEVVKVHDV